MCNLYRVFHNIRPNAHVQVDDDELNRKVLYCAFFAIINKILIKKE